MLPEHALHGDDLQNGEGNVDLRAAERHPRHVPRGPVVVGDARSSSAGAEGGARRRPDGDCSIARLPPRVRRARRGSRPRARAPPVIVARFCARRPLASAFGPWQLMQISLKTTAPGVSWYTGASRCRSGHAHPVRRGPRRSPRRSSAGIDRSPAPPATGRRGSASWRTARSARWSRPGRGSRRHQLIGVGRGLARRR